MGFDPRRWRPSSGSRPLTTNVEALLAENDALRREVRSLRLQLEALLQGNARDFWSWDPSRVASEATAAAARSRASRSSWAEPEPPRQRVTVGSAHGLSAELVERWTRKLALHPRWQALRIGPPGGLRGLEEELRRHWWNPSLSLEQELDRRSPGLGAELTEALRGPHSRGRWAVRAAFALYGPRAPEWLSEDPLRVVEELLRRVQQLEQRAGTGARRRGTRTANTSGAEEPAGSGRRSGRRGAGPGAGQQRPGSHSPGSRQAAATDPRTQALAELGLEAGASPAAIKRAYRRLAKAHHPDLGGDVEAFRRLDAAYRSLL